MRKLSKSNVLTEVDTVEVSLVDRGANRKRYALRKQEKPMKMTDAQTVAFKKMLAGIKVGDVPAKIAKALEGMSEQARQAILSAMGILTAARSELPEGLLQEVMAACGIESPVDLLDLISPADAPAASDNTVAAGADSAATTTPEEQPMTAQATKSATPNLDDASKAQIAKAEKAAADAHATVAQLKKQAEEDGAKRVALEKQVAVERDARLNRDFLTKAEKLPGLPMKASELGSLLKRLNDADPKLAVEIEKLLTETNTKLEAVSSLLVEKGFTPPPGADDANPGATTAHEQLQKKADEIRKTEPKLTAAQAFTKALDANPKLYEQYNAEHAESLRTR